LQPVMESAARGSPQVRITIRDLARRGLVGHPRSDPLIAPGRQ
jgi:hypothetical protein